MPKLVDRDHHKLPINFHSVQHVQANIRAFLRRTVGQIETGNVPRPSITCARRGLRSIVRRTCGLLRHSGVPSHKENALDIVARTAALELQRLGKSHLAKQIFATPS